MSGAELKWVGSAGGPLVLMPRARVEDFAPDEIDQLALDAGGDETSSDEAPHPGADTLATLPVADVHGIVIGGESLATTWYPLAEDSGLLIRWRYAKSEDDVVDTVFDLTPDDPEWPKASAHIEIPLSPLVLFDGAVAGDAIDDDASLTIQLEPGDYEVCTRTIRDEERGLSLILHLLRRRAVLDEESIPEAVVPREKVDTLEFEAELDEELADESTLEAGGEEHVRDVRRTYYDHEPAYRRIAESGGRGWDDRANAPGEPDSYVSLRRFLDSPWAPRAGARALELGCGGGQAALMMARHGWDTVGVDFSQTAVELARENAREEGVEVEFVVADATSLDDFATNSFEAVVDNHCLHCLVESSDRRAVLAEAARLLVPGGALFSETMTCEGDFRPDQLGVDPTTRVSAEQSRFWVSKLELDEELRDAGFLIMRQYTRRQAEGAGFLFVTYAILR